MFRNLRAAAGDLGLRLWGKASPEQRKQAKNKGSVKAQDIYLHQYLFTCSPAGSFCSIPVTKLIDNLEENMEIITTTQIMH